MSSRPTIYIFTIHASHHLETPDYLFLSTFVRGGPDRTGGSTERGTELRTLHILLNKPPATIKVQRLKNIFVMTIGPKSVEYVGVVYLLVEIPF
jgi:hypothetical protein